MEINEMEVSEKQEAKVSRTDRLAKAGFVKAAQDLRVMLTKKRKLAIAYELYRFVTPENVAKFNADLLKKTGKNLNDAWNQEYSVLAFVPIQSYGSVPPDEVITKLEEAQSHKCFDQYEVAYILDVKDPLLFGRVEGSPNRFFIAQWDDDVKIDDLIKENEG